MDRSEPEYYICSDRIGGAGRGHLKFFTIKRNRTNLPYFGVKLSCVCLMFADRKKIAYSYLKVT